jgi:hypothetical protein
MLDLSVRIHDMLRLHGRKFLGNDLQRCGLDLSRLRGSQGFRERLRGARKEESDA